VNPRDGKIVWSSGVERRFGMYEPLLLADGNLYVMSVSGYLTVVRATPEGYQELGRTLILEGSRGWHPWMALAGGRLIARESHKLVCVDLNP
jgi:outer membrane protein assembly factor BamB